MIYNEFRHILHIKLNHHHTFYTNTNMRASEKIYKEFITHLTDYIQLNGEQTVPQIKDLAKEYCINSRNGLYDITARKRYYYLFINYLYKNNLQFPGWDIMTTSHYDPDNELPNDPQVIRLKRKEELMMNARINQTAIQIAEMEANLDDED
jgi:hypothetical protein